MEIMLGDLYVSLNAVALIASALVTATLGVSVTYLLRDRW